MILNYRLLIKYFSTDFELFVGYNQIIFFSTEYLMFLIQNVINIMEMHDRSISIVEWWLITLPRPNVQCAGIFKMASHEPILQSIIDWFGQTDDCCENRADSQH